MQLAELAEAKRQRAGHGRLDTRARQPAAERRRAPGHGRRCEGHGQTHVDMVPYAETRCKHRRVNGFNRCIPLRASGVGRSSVVPSEGGHENADDRRAQDTGGSPAHDGEGH